MTDTTSTLRDVTPFDCLRLSQGVSHRVLLSAVIFGLSLVATARFVAPSFSAKPEVEEKAADVSEAAPLAVQTAGPGSPYGTLAKRYSRLPPILTDLGFILDLAPDVAFSPSATSGPEVAELTPPAQAAEVAPPPQSDPEANESVPLPPLRPPLFRPRVNHVATARPATPTTATTSSETTPDNRNFFEKLFDLPAQPSGTALAYAEPEDRSVKAVPTYNTSIVPQANDRYTAVYDVAAHTVYLPNGERLEAHSGLGNLLDDPRYVNAKDRGPTPPHLYDLELRKQLFHGVQALRLNPVGSGNMYGRTGLLAHTFMLGPNGDSNGCVSFRDYSKFLQAFMSGEVRHLAVVAHMS
jgi:hypothetical protein